MALTGPDLLESEDGGEDTVNLGLVAHASVKGNCVSRTVSTVPLNPFNRGDKRKFDTFDKVLGQMPDMSRWTEDYVRRPLRGATAGLLWREPWQRVAER